MAIDTTERGLMTMGIISDLTADGDRCNYCGRLLCKHYGGKRTRELLRLWDDDVVFATMVDIRCSNCGETTTIFYQADMLPAVSTTKTLELRFVPAA